MRELAVALALLIVGGHSDSPHADLPTDDPDLQPVKDAKSFHSQLYDHYKARILEYEAQLDEVDDKNSMEAIKKKMIIHEFELSRAEACRNVLHSHGIYGAWKTDHKKDNTNGGVPGGYDTPMVPSLRRRGVNPMGGSNRRLLSENGEENVHLDELMRPDLGETASTTSTEVEKVSAAVRAGTKVANKEIAEMQAEYPTWYFEEGPKELARKIEELQSAIKHNVDIFVGKEQDVTEACKAHGEAFCDAFKKQHEQDEEKLTSYKKEMGSYTRVKNECASFIAQMKERRNFPKEDYVSQIIAGWH